MIFYKLKSVNLSSSKFRPQTTFGGGPSWPKKCVRAEFTHLDDMVVYSAGERNTKWYISTSTSSSVSTLFPPLFHQLGSQSSSATFCPHICRVISIIICVDSGRAAAAAATGYSSPDLFKSPYLIFGASSDPQLDPTRCDFKSGSCGFNFNS